MPGPCNVFPSCAIHSCIFHLPITENPQTCILDLREIFFSKHKKNTRKWSFYLPCQQASFLMNLKKHSISLENNMKISLVEVSRLCLNLPLFKTSAANFKLGKLKAALELPRVKSSECGKKGEGKTTYYHFC